MSKKSAQRSIRLQRSEQAGGRPGTNTRACGMGNFQLALSISPSLPDIIGRGEARNKFCNYFENSLIDIFLRFVSDIFCPNGQRMIAVFDGVEKIRRGHLCANALQ